MSTHARLSPSGAARWIHCPGSLALEEQCPPQKDSVHSAEGTAAHELASWALTDGYNRCEAYIGKKVENGWEVTKEMAEDTQIYVDNILEYAEGNTLLVEQRVPLEHITREKDAWGTSDAVIISKDGEDIEIHDLKFGRGIQVDAEENEQLMMYALGAIEQFAMFGDFKRIKMVIHQPRLGHLSEWSCTIEELKEFEKSVMKAAIYAFDHADGPTKEDDYIRYLFNPSEKTCQWCRAKATCPALNNKIKETLTADFLDLTVIGDVKKLVPKDGESLADKMNAIPMIEDWCKAVRAEVELMLLDGSSVPGYKLVEGKKGNRAWSDKAEVETALKSMRLKIEEMYNFTLISPTDAEKLLAKEHPRQWTKLQGLISRKDGAPSVAPESDKRPALNIKPVLDHFDIVPEETV